MTGRTLLAALLIGAAPALADDLSTPTLGDDSAYTLTKVDAAGDNTITKFEYNSSTGEFTPVYYRMDLKNTTYGEGADSKYFQLEDKYGDGQYYLTEVDTPEPGRTTITVKYDAAATGNYTTQYKDINSTVEATNPESTSSNHYQMIGGAVKDVTNFENVLFENNTTNAILNVSGGGNSFNDRKNVYADVLGGALYNDADIGDISGAFINNSITTTVNEAGTFDYGTLYSYGGAIYNKGTIGNINADFINNKAIHGAAIYNTGTIKDITGNFINNSDNSSASIIYNSGNIGNISGNFVDNTGDVIVNTTSNNDITVGNITGNFINNFTAIENTAASGNITMGNINANFINTSALNNSVRSNNSIKIDDINGDFINSSIYNYVYSSDASLTIGNITGNFINSGIQNNGETNYKDNLTIGDVTGDFINSYIKNEYGSMGNITGDFINSNGSYGAIYNRGGSIKDITGNFMHTDISYSPTGRAIYNNNGTIGNVSGDFIGNSTGDSSDSHGGAIRNDGSYAKIGNISGNFINNSTLSRYSDGGAIYNNAEMGDVEGNFIGNFSNGNGGAIYKNYDGSMGNITGNFIQNSANGSGGAIGLYNGSDEVGDISGTFIENTAGISGGAIDNRYGPITNITGTFIRNSALNESADNNWVYNHYSGAGGGAIFTTDSIYNITAEFVENKSNNGGAIAYANQSNNMYGPFVNITDSVFDTNTATREGGAIVIDELYYNHVPFNGTLSDSVSIKNSSFENNKAQRGGAISFTKDVSPTMPGPASLLPDDTGIELYSDPNYNEPQMPEYNLDIDNSSFKNNIAETVDNIDAHGGAISFKGISADPGNTKNSYTYSKVTLTLVDENGEPIANVIDGFGIIPDRNNSGIEVLADPMKNIIQNSYFENNKATSDNNAYGGAISVTSTGTFANNELVEGQEINATVSITEKPEWITTTEEFIEELKDHAQDFVPEFRDYNNIVDNVNIDELKESLLSNKQNSLELVNTSFVNNTAETTGQNKEAHGGAIFSQTNLKITADNGVSLFDGNKVISNGKTDNEAIYMNNINPDGSELQLNIEAKNNGVVQFNDKIDGDKPYVLNVDGDSTSKIIFNDDVKNADITLGKTNVYLGKDTAFDQANSLTVDTELYSMVNDYAGISNINSLVLKSDTDFTADIDLANKEMDRFQAGSYDIQNDAKLHVVGMNLLSDANMDEDVTAVYFAEPGLKNNVVNGTGELPDSYQTAYTPIYKYNVTYDNENEYDGKGDGGYFLFTRGDKIIYPDGGGGSTGNDSDAFNPAVLATPVGNLAAGQAAVNEAFKYVFEHADAFTQLPAMERYAKINANKYALSTDFNDNMPEYFDQLHNNAVWFRPYTTFESMNLDNGPNVDAITYGSLVGFDGDFKEMKNGWHRVFTGYAGYMGSSLNYSGVDTSMNGGLLGFTETFYKGNFWTAITASAGASVGESHTMYGKEDYTSLLAGVGSKTGYNFEFKDGKFIIQPIMYLSYTFVNTFDYKNAAGVNIESDPLHTIQLNPSVRFIANLKGGWQPYASVGMVWNLMNESKVTANNVKLPEMSVKPYVEYGVGVQRNWADKFTAFLQAMIRNGGRNGIALTGGFRFMLGSDKDNSDKPKVKKEIKSL